ncbi:MAG: hypothetical protein IPM64_15535 [Phycisphaerales bacterium]|nr:hypothetical protein [Phycisphaerales bacterium]
MLKASAQSLTAGTKVSVLKPGPVPAWSEWDNDNQRTSTSVKKRLQEMFFKGDRKVQAEVLYVASESERDSLKRKGRVKLTLRDPAGSRIVVTAESAALRPC